jgi:thioredoxin-dependent peroxiredoxin
MSFNLKEGDKAPLFTAPDQHGNIVKLSDYKGKQVVLYFYPKDDTPGCTKEACNFRDNFNMLKKKGIVVLGVSADSVKSHAKFADKFDLPFTLVSDEEKKIVEAYGVLGEKKFMGRTFMGIIRTTFIIDEKGKIKKIITKVDNDNATEQALEFI